MKTLAKVLLGLALSALTIYLFVRNLDLDKVREVRNTWQFYRDRRPELYGDIADTGAA